MSVDDSGLEVLKKAASQVTPGDPSEYYLKVFEAEWLNVKNSADRQRLVVWLDFGTSDARVDYISYSSVTAGKTATETFNWTLDSGSYRFDGSTRSLA